MYLRAIIGLLLMATIIGSANSQQFRTSAEIARPVKKKTYDEPKYAIAYFKVVARENKGGFTKFNYEGNRLVSEISPKGVVGTYAYDRNGRFTSISYSNGENIRAEYDASGKILGLSGTSKIKVKFRGLNKKHSLEHGRNKPLAGFLTIQDGISLMGGGGDTECPTDGTACVIIIGHPEEGGGGGGGGGSWGGGGESDPGGEPLGGGGGGGNGAGNWGSRYIYPNTGTPYPTTEECRKEVCDDSKWGMDVVCGVLAKTPDDKRRCYSKNLEWEAQCRRSCASADWYWLENWNPVY